MCLTCLTDVMSVCHMCPLYSVRDADNGENKENIYNINDHPSICQTDHSQHPGQMISDKFSSLRKAACPSIQSGVSSSTTSTVSCERPAKSTDYTVGLGLKLTRIPSPTSALTPTSQPASSTDDVRALLQPRYSECC